MPAISNAYRGCRTPASHRAIVSPPEPAKRPSIRRASSQTEAFYWTLPEDEMLLQKRAEGWSFRAIGRRVGRSKSSCVSRFIRLSGGAV